MISVLHSHEMKHVDVILVTHGRAGWLFRCLESLRLSAERAGIEPRFLVALNGDDRESLAVLRELAIDFRQTEQKTPGDARNSLLNEASAEWLCFVDDDAFVEPGYFETFLEVARRNPDAAAIGGPNLTPPGASRFERAVGEVLAHPFATFTSSARYSPRGLERSCDESALILCNLFLRRAALLSERFPDRVLCAEENWLLARLKRKGERLVYSPELKVYHERRAGFFSLGRQVYKYGHGRGENIRLQPRSLRVAHVLPAICVLFAVAALVGALFGVVAPGAFELAGAYVVLLALFSVGHRRAWLFAAAIYPLIHVCYGVGVLAGVFIGTRSEPRRAPASALAGNAS